ncbi:sulfurtransferase TusA family protein [Candidatus Acetothermia bacterium]|nr:sulfurtransferase TusA family protein [Candidatus Acetothermia bacterium]MCI2427328.1 sulfurtransferase TusA family protein [Candidatus Acetothermia bacterium]MCI2428494.1 sulfurtransferase TusA family protein [Candidatus Acetothermia bacterium]
MAEQIDLCGLSCPLPVVKTKKRLVELQRGLLEVIVDTAVAQENIIRMAKNNGWKVDTIIRQDGKYQLTLSKK